MGARAYIGLGLCDLRGELGVRRRQPHLRQLCRGGLVFYFIFWRGAGDACATCRCGLDLRSERLVALEERVGFVGERLDRVLWERVERVLIRDEKRGLACDYVCVCVRARDVCICAYRTSSA